MKLINFIGNRLERPEPGRAGIRSRALAWAVTLCMLVSLLPTFTLTAGASDIKACSHVHDELCGYVESAPCVYLCGDDCGEVDTTSPSELSVCEHAHDDDCGFIEAVPCGYVCGEDCFVAPMAAIGIMSLEEATVTATAQDGTFDTNPHIGFAGLTFTAINSGADITAEIGDNYTVNYTNRDGTAYNSATPPTNAGNYTATITINADQAYEGTGTVDFTISKAPGAAVSGAPSLSINTSLSITVTAVTSTDTAKNPNVQYAISTVNNALASELSWGSVRAWTGLVLDTTYYAYARTQESADYNAGEMQVSVGITTDKPSLRGIVTIIGDAVFGETLTTVTTGLTSSPVIGGGSVAELGTISYQWNRGSEPIDNATSSTYTLVAADVGHTITVIVSTLNTAGIQTSDPTATVTCDHGYNETVNCMLCIYCGTTRTPICNDTCNACKYDHDVPTTWIVRTAATCTADGEEYRVCTLPGCDYEETRPTTALGHDFGTSKNNGTHECKRTGCTVTQTCSPNTSGATCSTCGYRTPTGGGSGGGFIPSQPTAPANIPQTVTQAAANTATSNAITAATTAGSTTATVNIRNAGDISLTTLQTMAASAARARMTLRLKSDSMTTDNRRVEVRITLNPALSTQNLNLSASTTNAQATQTKSRFERFFSNSNINVINLGQQGSFGQSVTIAARIPIPADFNLNNLHFYSYDRASNSYRRIINPAPMRLDSNGYLHFNTTLGGDIIITTSPLVRR